MAAAGARGRGMPLAHHFGGPRQAPGPGGIQVQNTSMGAAFVGMKDLMK